MKRQSLVLVILVLLVGMTISCQAVESVEVVQAPVIAVEEVVEAPVVVTEVVVEETPEPTVAPTTEPPTAVPPTPTIAATPEPTIAHPNGRRIELLYDNNSFYFYNPTNNRIDMRPLSFEAIDENGNPLRYQLDASMWTQFYTYVDGGNCDSVEINRAGSHLNPPQCRNYNANLTPDRDDDQIFWTANPGIARFRVSWNGNEIARCELGGERCVVYLPQ